MPETWRYTSSYTVQQSDIDNGGVVNHSLKITNTASADRLQTVPESASLSVNVLQNPHLSFPTRRSSDLVDAAGDLINYTVTVANTGNMTLTGLTVADPLVT